MMCQQICINPPCDCDIYACRCIPDEQAVADGIDGLDEECPDGEHDWKEDE